MVVKCAPHKARMYQDAHWFRPRSLGRGKGIKDYFGTKPGSKIYKGSGQKEPQYLKCPCGEIVFFYFKSTVLTPQQCGQ